MIYLALLHYPVYNKKHDVVATSITGFDLHDIARTALTFGVKGYYVVNPMQAQREFAEKIRECWMDEASIEFNWTRAAAFQLINIQADLDAVIQDITNKEGKKPVVIGTSAKEKGAVRFEELKSLIQKQEDPYLLVLGTGWGMADELFSKFDLVLEPIKGVLEYNHLPVRSANAIILYRLLGNVN